MLACMQRKHIWCRMPWPQRDSQSGLVRTGSLSQTRGAVEPDPRGILMEVSLTLWRRETALLPQPCHSPKIRLRLIV